jgi:hypothetical protein
MEARGKATKTTIGGKGEILDGGQVQEVKFETASRIYSHDTRVAHGLSYIIR